MKTEHLQIQMEIQNNCMESGNKQDQLILHFKENMTSLNQFKRVKLYFYSCPIQIQRNKTIRIDLQISTSNNNSTAISPPALNFTFKVM